MKTRAARKTNGWMDGWTHRQLQQDFHDDIKTQLNKLKSLLSWGVTGKGRVTRYMD